MHRTIILMQKHGNSPCSCVLCNEELHVCAILNSGRPQCCDFVIALLLLCLFLRGVNVINGFSRIVSRCQHPTSWRTSSSVTTVIVSAPRTNTRGKMMRVSILALDNDAANGSASLEQSTGSRTKSKILMYAYYSSLLVRKRMRDERATTT